MSKHDSSPEAARDATSTTATLRCPFCRSGARRRGATNSLGTQGVTVISCKSCSGFNTDGAGWSA